MKRNRLYTVNKWNKPAFTLDKNMFYDGGIWEGLATKGLNTRSMTPKQIEELTDLYKQDTNWFGLSKEDNPFSKGNIKGGIGAMANTPIGGGIVSGVAGAVGGLIGNAIRGDYDDGGVGSTIGSIGSTVGGALSKVNPLIGGAVSIGSQLLGGLASRAFGIKENKQLKEIADNSINSNRNFMSNATSFDDIKGPASMTNTNIYENGWFTSRADDKNAKYAQDMASAYSWADRSIGNNVANITSDQLSDNLRNYSAYGGPLDFGGGALGLMQQNRYFDTIDKRSEAIAGKGQGMQTGFTGGAKTFDFGGLKSSFLDEFGSDPIGAAVRYNQGLENLAAQEEAKQIEAAKEAEYLGLQQRLNNLETENQGLQALMAAQTVPAIPETSVLPSSSTPSRATSNGSTWDYIEDQLRRSGKFNDVQIEGIKYNLQRESSLDPTAVGDGGSAFGLGQWHGDRKPSDMSLEGQTQHLINTLSNYDGRLHWIGKDNYEGFMNARTPEEAHYYIARGYERPAQRIVDKVKRYSDMSLRRLNAFGGELGTNGTDWTNGLLYIDEGGSHESNPLEGVPMGLDPQGIPNLVEEGETVYNDYVFSDRMKVPFFMYKELGLGGVMKKKGKEMSFADASKKLAQESEQRPNDPISQDGLQASLSRLAEVQEAERMKKNAKEYMGLEGYACGGKINNKYGGNNPYGQRMTIGMQVPQKGFLSNRTPVRPLFQAAPAGSTSAFATAFPNLNLDFSEWLPNGSAPIDYNATTDVYSTGETSGSKPESKTKKKLKAQSKVPTDTESSNRKFGQGETNGPEAPISIVTDETWELDPYSEGWEERRGISTEPDEFIEDVGDMTEEQEIGQKKNAPKKYATWMRYAPVFGAGAMALTDMLGLTNNPDYTMANKLEAAANGAAYAPNIEYKPIGDYMRYTPLDRQFHTNQLMASSRATDRALANSSSPSRAAGLLANGYNTTLSLGNLARQAEEYNRAIYERTKDFNRKTNMFNSQMDLEAAMANARYRQQAQSLGLSGLAQAAALRNDIDARTGAAKSANLSNFLTSLGNIGRENFAMNQINWDRSNPYKGRLDGTSYYERETKYGGKIRRRK